MSLDRILKHTDGFGLYQKYIILLITVQGLYGAFIYMNSVFILYVPEHRCAIPGYANDTFAVQDDYHQTLINRTIPLPADQTPGYDECHVFPANVEYGLDNRPVNASARTCDRWVYDDSVLGETLAAKLNFVCDRKALKSTGQMIFSAGVFVGSLVCGILSDRFGRKTTSLISLLLLIGATVALAWTPGYPFYFVFRFLVGVSSMSFYLPLHVLSMELVGPSGRKFASIVGNFTWVIGQLLLTAMAYRLPGWHYLQLACSLSGIPFLVYWWLLPESPRWLIGHGRVEECKKILRRIAKVNKKPVPEDLLNTLLDNAKEEKGNVWNIFTSRILRIRTIVLYINWIVVCMTYYGLALNSGNLAGNFYLNFTLNALMDLPAAFLTFFLVDRTGRKPLHIAYMLFGGVACLATILTTQFGGKDLEKLTISLALIGKVGASSAFMTTYLYTAELYPTVVRNASLGSCSCMARIGGMVAPFIADMETLVGGGRFGKALPMLLFGVLSVAAGLLMFPLPETLNRPLPETIADAENFHSLRKGRESYEKQDVSMDEYPFLDGHSTGTKKA